MSSGTEAPASLSSLADGVCFLPLQLTMPAVLQGKCSLLLSRPLRAGLVAGAAAPSRDLSLIHEARSLCLTSSVSRTVLGIASCSRDSGENWFL